MSFIQRRRQREQGLETEGACGQRARGRAQELAPVEVWMATAVHPSIDVNEFIRRQKDARVAGPGFDLACLFGYATMIEFFLVAFNE